MRTDDGLLVVGADEGLAGPGDIVVKLRASQTGGRWGVAVVSGVPGEGGRTHFHRGEPEGFFVLQGEIELLGVSSQTPIGPGTFVLVPPDTEHGLRIVGTDEARWLAIWPAALDGFVEELLTLDPDDAAGAGRRAPAARYGTGAGPARRFLRRCASPARSAPNGRCGERARPGPRIGRAGAFMVAMAPRDVRRARVTIAGSCCRRRVGTSAVLGSVFETLAGVPIGSASALVDDPRQRSTGTRVED